MLLVLAIERGERSGERARGTGKRENGLNGKGGRKMREKEENRRGV